MTTVDSFDFSTDVNDGLFKTDQAMEQLTIACKLQRAIAVGHTSAATIKLATIAFEDIRNKLGLTNYTNSLSVEKYKECLSSESIGNFIGKIWQAIKNAISWIVSKIKRFIAWILGRKTESAEAVYISVAEADRVSDEVAGKILEIRNSSSSDVESLSILLAKLDSDSVEAKLNNVLETAISEAVTSKEPVKIDIRDFPPIIHENTTKADIDTTPLLKLPNSAPLDKHNKEIIAINKHNIEDIKAVEITVPETVRSFVEKINYLYGKVNNKIIEKHLYTLIKLLKGLTIASKELDLKSMFNQLIDAAQNPDMSADDLNKLQRGLVDKTHEIFMNNIGCFYNAALYTKAKIKPDSPNLEHWDNWKALYLDHFIFVAGSGSESGERFIASMFESLPVAELSNIQFVINGITSSCKKPLLELQKMVTNTKEIDDTFNRLNCVFDHLQGQVIGKSEAVFNNVNISDTASLPNIKYTYRYLTYVVRLTNAMVCVQRAVNNEYDDACMLVKYLNSTKKQMSKVKLISKQQHSDHMDNFQNQQRLFSETMQHLQQHYQPG